MVMVQAFVEFINRLVTVKTVAAQQSGLLKLGQHPVNGGHAHIQSLLQQRPIDVFGAHVALRGVLEQAENLHAGSGGLEAGVFYFFSRIHAWGLQEQMTAHYSPCLPGRLFCRLAATMRATGKTGRPQGK